MKLGSVILVPHILKAIGLAMIIVGVCGASATAFADDPGTIPAPKCRRVNGLCKNFGCGPQIPHCGDPAPFVDCACH